MWYVYILLDQRVSGEWILPNNDVVKFKPFYVGKGKGYRVTQHFTKSALKNNENPHKKNKIKKIKEELGENPKYIKVKQNIATSKLAGDLETEYITYINNKYPGILTNILPGGEQPPIMRGKDNPKAIKVYQFNLYGTFIKEWDCEADAARETGTSSAHISSCCKGKRRSTGGFLWSYTKNKVNVTINKKYAHFKYTKIIAYNKIETLEFNSQKEAYCYFNCKNKGKIKFCIDHPEYTYKGYYWKSK